MVIKDLKQVIDAIESDALHYKPIDDCVSKEIAVAQKIVIVSFGLDIVLVGFDAYYPTV